MNSYTELLSMPRKRIQRCRSGVPTACMSIQSLLASLSQITPIPTGRVSVLLEDEVKDDDPAETHVQEAAHHPDDEDEDEHKDDST